MDCILLGPFCRNGLSPQGEPRSERPLNGDRLPSNRLGFGRRLQQAAKSFPAERTYRNAISVCSTIRQVLCHPKQAGNWPENRGGENFCDLNSIGGSAGRNKCVILPRSTKSRCSLVRTVREIIDRILLSPGRGEGRVRGIKRDSYLSSGPYFLPMQLLILKRV